MDDKNSNDSFGYSTELDPFLLFTFLLLSGDTELNPGRTNFTVCTLNICSILHPPTQLCRRIRLLTLIVLIFSVSLKPRLNPLRPTGILNLLSAPYLWFGRGITSATVTQYVCPGSPPRTGTWQMWKRNVMTPS